MGAGPDTPWVRVVESQGELDSLGVSATYSDDSWFLVVGLGKRPTAGFGLRVLELEPEGDTLVVVAQEVCPPPGAMVAMVLTNPWVLIRVSPKLPFQGFRVRLEPCGQ